MIMSYNIAQIKVRYDPQIFSREEILKYIETSKKKIPNLTSITFRLDGDRVACEYVARAIPFERIRRITGYLTGDLKSWNDAKRAEEFERVKHGVEEYEI